MVDFDDFLSAPDSVRMNEAEKQKYILRKAEESAEEERSRNSKLPDPPSIEDLISDMRRVACDPETNPYHQDKILSRKRYIRFGAYYIRFVEKQIGQFEHAKQVAGLVDQPATRTWKAARAAESRREHAARYQERYMHPFVYNPKNRELTNTELIISISDTHATFLDPFTWHVFLRTVKELQPDYIYFNGDILEGAEISRHPKIPGWSVPMQLELDFAKEMFRQLRVVAPDPDVIWGSGNHGLDRLAMYMSQEAKGLSSLRMLRFDKLLDLDGLGIQLAQGGSWASPAGTEDALPGTLFHNCNLVYHGTMLGASPYLSELRKHGYSGQSGHVHRAGLAYSTTEEGGSRCWMSTPMGCVPRAGRAYLFRQRETGWQSGFGVSFMHPGGRVHQYPVVTSGGVAVVEGMVFTNPGIPEPDPQRLWLPDFEVPI